MNLVKDFELLVKLAQKFDDEGRTSEAQLLDGLAMKIASEQEEDEKKGDRAMSGKAKAKFRALKKAAQSLVDADLDYRGPHKSACRKVEMLAEDMLDALADCDFE